MRPKSKKGDKIFNGLLAQEDWKEVYDAVCPSLKAEKLANKLDSLMLTAYPTKNKKIRNTDDPWIDDHIRSQICTRNKTFKREFRSNKWHKQKRNTKVPCLEISCSS